MSGLCAECLSGFLGGSNLWLIMSSWGVSFITLLGLRWKRELSVKQKLGLMYAHLFTLLFPFMYFLFYEGCDHFLSGCRGFLKASILVLLTAVLSWIGVSLISPFLFLRNCVQSSRLFPHTHLTQFVKKVTERLHTQLPKLYFVDSEKPFAFSLYYRRPAVFISIGLSGLLSRKEGEAVVLHELYHLKSRASVYKWSAQLVHALSPFSKLACFYKDLGGEEKQADRFAIRMQRTAKFLRNAKRKVRLFYNS